MIGKRPTGYRKGWRACSCHPDEAPTPCARRYALAECLAKSLEAPAASPASGHLHRLEAPNPSPPEPSAGWRGIESAPRDGRVILAFGGGLEGHIDMVSYNLGIDCWDCSEFTLDDRDGEPEGYSRPTHWMPLPSPPSEPAKSASGPVGELEEHKALSPLATSNGSSVAGVDMTPPSGASDSQEGH